MFKKIISLILVVCMMLTLAVAVSAECEPTIYMYATKPNASGVFNVFVALKNNIVPTTNDGSEQLGLGSYGLTVEYDKEKFTLNNIAKAGTYEGSPMTNKAAASASFSAANGLRKGTIDEETGETTYEYFENTDLLKFFFKINAANITEEDYGKEFEFRFSADSNAAGLAGATIVIDTTPLMFEIPDTREPIAGLNLESKTVIYNGEAVEYPTVEGTPAGAVTNYTVNGVENAVIKDAGTYEVVATTKLQGYKPTQTTATVVVNKAPVTLTIADANKVYGDEDPEFNVTINGLLNRDTLDYTIKRELGEDRGQYQISANLGENKNYDVRVIPGTLLIQKPEIYATVSKGSNNAQVYLDVFIRDNFTSKDTNENGTIDEEETNGIGAYQIGINYDTEKFTLKSIIKGQTYDGEPITNIPKATAVWTIAAGLIKTTIDEEDGSSQIEGLENAHLLRYVFSMNLDKVSEADYGTLASFAIDATSETASYNGEIFINRTPADYTIPILLYTYKFVDGDGYVLKTGTAKHGNTIEAPSFATKSPTAQYTYTFKGWEGFTDGMTLKEDMTFNAVFDATLNKYTYTFYDEDGTTELKKETVDYGTVITPPEVPTKASTVQYSYTFKEWEGLTDGMTVTGNVTFKPVFDATLNKYTYTFYDEDGTTELKKQTVDYGTVITPPEVPAKPSSIKYTYTFKGWEGFTDGMTVAGDVTFKPVFDTVYNQYIAFTDVPNVTVGDTFTAKVEMVTLTSANYLICKVVYPSSLELLSVTPKDFQYATKGYLETKDGLTYLTIIQCKYADDDSLTIPQNTVVNPFDLTFKVSKTATPQEIEIGFDKINSYLSGENGKFENIANAKIEILPKLADYVTLTGENEIFEPTQYTATVYPDYTTDKNIIWSVDDETIAKISANGTLTPVKNGTVTITATAVGGATKSITVKVHKKAYVDNFKSNIGIWKEMISTDTKKYTIEVPAGTETISISPFFTNGILQYNDTIMVSGYANTFVLTSNETTLTFTRHSADYDDCTYTIKVIRKPDLKNETVNAENFKEDCINMLVYNKGAMYVKEKEDVTVTVPEVTKNYKVLYWESLMNLKPVSAPVEKTF